MAESDQAPGKELSLQTLYMKTACVNRGGGDREDAPEIPGQPE